MRRISFEDMRDKLQQVLLKLEFTPPRADLCARLIAETSLDGVYSHGLNRFPRFVEYIRAGRIKVDAEPERRSALGAIEQWDGNLGPGNLNAWASMQRAMDLARVHGLGCVALRNTNHWMRGGTYGWQVAEAGFAAICWTNTCPNLPPWGAREPRLGNNPLVLALPRAGVPLGGAGEQRASSGGAHVVLDMAMSQYSFGKLELLALRGGKLPQPGGFDAHGALTDDPRAILESKRALPIGFWKGSGLSLLLDMLAAVLSGGKSVHEIGGAGAEYGLSQVFVAFDLSKLNPAAIEGILEDLRAAEPAQPGGEVLYPGERTLRTREENLARGIPVDESVWQEVLALEQ